MLSVSRWYFRDSPAEMYRTHDAGGRGAAAESASQEPRRHIAIVRNMRPSRTAPEMPDGVGTLLVSRRPFTDAELDTHRAGGAADLGFEVHVQPAPVARPDVRAADRARCGRAFLARYPINITRADRRQPVLLQHAAAARHPAAGAARIGQAEPQHEGGRDAGVLLVTVTVLTALCILLPLWMPATRVAAGGAGPLLVFFIAIGLGFMLIETSQMQRLIIALGHPTYGLSRRAVRAAAVERRSAAT